MFPRQLKVGGITYRVLLVDLVDEHQGLRGQIIHDEATVRVSADQPEDAQYESLLHETVHACEIAAGFKLPEDTVERLARALFAILRDNPSLFRGQDWELPAAIKVGGIRYAVRLMDLVEPKTNTISWTKSLEREVAIDRRLPAPVQRREMAFALINLAAHFARLELKLNHVWGLGYWLLAVLTDNPDLLGSAEVTSGGSPEAN